MKNISIKQTRGPSIYSKGNLICETDFDTRDGTMQLEVWETQGGAYIAVSRMEYFDTGDLDVRAKVIEHSEDQLAMRLAVMDYFAWADRARSMVREQTNWDLRLKVA